MGGLSWWHWVIIAAAFVLLFGARRLPDAARGLGRSLRILKSEVAAMESDRPADEQATSTVVTAQQLPRPDGGRGAVSGTDAAGLAFPSGGAAG